MLLIISAPLATQLQSGIFTDKIGTTTCLQTICMGGLRALPLYKTKGALTKNPCCDKISFAACSGLKCAFSRRPRTQRDSAGKEVYKGMYAIIETGGKQYKVAEGDVLYIEKLNVEPESTVTFDKVIAVGKDDGITVGTPVVAGAKVTAKAIKNGKAKKVTVFTYRPKKDSKRKMGHRQPYTKVQIEAINA